MSSCPTFYVYWHNPHQNYGRLQDKNDCISARCPDAQTANFRHGRNHWTLLDDQNKRLCKIQCTLHWHWQCQWLHWNKRFSPIGPSGPSWSSSRNVRHLIPFPFDFFRPLLGQHRWHDQFAGLSLVHRRGRSTIERPRPQVTFINKYSVSFLRFFFFLNKLF